MNKISYSETSETYVRIFGINEEKDALISVDDPNRTLVELDSVSRYLSPSFLTLFFEKLYGLRHLDTIILVGFFMSEENVNDLCDVMIRLQTVTTLRLPFIEGVGRLTDCLSRNIIPVKSLSCCPNPSTMNNVVAIIGSLSTNTTVTDFAVWSLHINDAIREAISGVLDHNPYLTSVSTFGLQVDDPFFFMGKNIKEKVLRNQANNHKVTLFELLIVGLNDLERENTNKRQRIQ